MTTLYWAGAENITLTQALLRNGVTTMLYSYHWIYQMRRDGFIARMKQNNPQLDLVLDSGAFTYAEKARLGGGDLPPPRLFFERYKEYLRNFGHLWSRVMEFDVDSSDDVMGVTVDEVDEWRSELLEEFPHLSICPVYHHWRGTEAWQSYLDDPRVKSLAIGRAAPSDPGIRIYVDAAHRVGKTVHGLAFTKYNTSLQWIPIDSVDSSSWVTGQRYGNFFVFHAGKLHNITTANRGKQRLKQYRTYIEARGCDPDLVMAGDRKELLECNIRTWILVSKRLELMRKQRGENLLDNPKPRERLPYPTSRK